MASEKIDITDDLKREIEELWTSIAGEPVKVYGNNDCGHLWCHGTKEACERVREYQGNGKVHETNGEDVWAYINYNIEERRIEPLRRRA